MSKLGAETKSSTSSSGPSGHARSSTSSGPLTAGTSFPVSGSGRIAIVPPVETTTTEPGTRLPRLARARGGRRLRAEPAGDAELLLDPVHGLRTEADANGGDDEDHRDHEQRQKRRRSTERVEIGPDGAREGDPADLERQRVGRPRLEEDAPVVVVPRQREAEQEAPEEPRPDQRERHLGERPGAPGSEVACGLLDPCVVAVPDGEHDEEAEGD